MKCPAWSSTWKATIDHEQEWPQGKQKVFGKLFGDDRLCVPTGLQEAWIQEQHKFLGHVGFHRLWETVEGRFFWADGSAAREYATRVARECTTCQACDPPLSLKSKIQPFPIPPQVMTNIAIDLFKMPLVLKDKIPYDTMVVSVDRTSGWITAVPTS